MADNDQVLGPQVIHQYIDWTRFLRDSRRLAQLIHDGHGPIKGIIAVARGGMYPAAIVARELDVRVIDTVCVGSYNGQVQGVTQIHKFPAITGEMDCMGWIIIDDLVDSGNTAEQLKKLYPGAAYATVYAKPLGLWAPDFYVKRCAQDVWLHFPWETTVSPAKPLKGEG